MEAARAPVARRRKTVAAGHRLQRRQTQSPDPCGVVGQEILFGFGSSRPKPALRIWVWCHRRTLRR